MSGARGCSQQVWLRLRSVLLSVLRTPCVKPTSCHSATMRAVRSVTSRKKARLRAAMASGDGSLGVRCGKCVLTSQSSI